MTFNPTKYDKETLFKEFEEYLDKRYKKEFIEIRIPVSIFCEKLSPFESIAKYLFENEKKSLSDIGRLLKKDRRVIWTTHKRASKKLPGQFKLPEHDAKIPLQKLVSGSLSVAELVVSYLKDELKLKNSEISRLIEKDNRTVWTLYSRASKKRGGGK